MKNLYFFILSFFLFVSCSDDISPDKQGETGVFSIELTIPDDVRTRAYSDGSTVNSIKCYVYDHDAGDNALPFMTHDIEIKNVGSKRGNHYDFTFVKGKTYDLVFLATAVDQTNPDSKVYYNPTLRTLNVDYAASKTNDEEMDCFFGVLPNLSDKSEKALSVTLKRPFAQLNIGAKDLAKYNIQSVGVSVDGVYSSMNIMDGSVAGDLVKAVFASNFLPSGQSFPVTGCDYLSMDYLLVNERKNVKVTMTTNDGTTSDNTDFADIPVQRNCQTNIYGDILAKGMSFNFDISIDSGIAGTINKDTEDPYADYNTSVIF